MPLTSPSNSELQGKQDGGREEKCLEVDRLQPDWDAEWAMAVIGVPPLNGPSPHHQSKPLTPLPAASMGEAVAEASGVVTFICLNTRFGVFPFPKFHLQLSPIPPSSCYPTTPRDNEPLHIRVPSFRHLFVAAQQKHQLPAASAPPTSPFDPLAPDRGLFHLSASNSPCARRQYHPRRSPPWLPPRCTT